MNGLATRVVLAGWLAVTCGSACRGPAQPAAPVESAAIRAAQDAPTSAGPLPVQLHVPAEGAVIPWGFPAVTFIWTALPERTEWRYAEASYKVIALDAGHVCQNLYLACQAVGCGTCAIAAYNQTLLDELLGVDGSDEFAVYLAPVGKLP